MSIYSRATTKLYSAQSEMRICSLWGGRFSASHLSPPCSSSISGIHRFPKIMSCNFCLSVADVGDPDATLDLLAHSCRPSSALIFRIAGIRQDCSAHATTNLQVATACRNLRQHGCRHREAPSSLLLPFRPKVNCLLSSEFPSEYAAPFLESVKSEG